MAAGSSAQLPPNLESRKVQQLCDIGSIRDSIQFVYNHAGNRCAVYLCGVSSKIYTFVVDLKNGNGCTHFYVSDESYENTDETWTPRHRLLNVIQQNDEIYLPSTCGYFYRLQEPKMEEIISTKMTKLQRFDAAKRSHILAVWEIRCGLIVVSSDDCEWIVDVYVKEDTSGKDLAFGYFTSYRVAHSSANVNQNIIPIVVHIQIECFDSTLYKLLFGPDALLAQSQVVVVGFSDGQVHAFVLKDYIRCQNENAAIHNRPILICSLHQPIKGIFLTSTTKGASNVLTILGENGSIVVLQASQDLPRVTKLIESHVPGPVLACDSHRGQLVHSDRNQVWLSCPAHLTGSEVQKCESRLLNSIRGILLLKLLPNSESDTQPFAIVLTTAGKVLMTRVDLLRKDDFTMPVGLDCGQNATLLLAEISASSLEVTKAKLESGMQQEIIQSLATASALLLSEKNDSFKTTCFIHRDQVTLSEDSLIRLQIENIGTARISRSSWQVFVSAHLKQADGTIRQQNYGVPLTEDFNPGHRLVTSLRIKFSTKRSSWQLPFKLCVSLNLLLPEKYIFGKSCASLDRGNCKGDHLCSMAEARLESFAVDEFYVLKPLAEKKATVKSSTVLTDNAEAISRLDLWERARMKPGFQEICDARLPAPSAISKTCISLSQTVAKEIAEYYKSDDIRDGIYAFICQSMEEYSPLSGIEELRLSCAGFPVSFQVRDTSKSVAVDIKTSEDFLAVNLRATFLRRFKAFKQTRKYTTVDDVALGPGVLSQVQRMRRDIEVQPELEPARQLQQVFDAYNDFRSGISSKLPLL